MCDQWVRRQAVIGHIGVEFGFRPIRQRVDLEPPRLVAAGEDQRSGRWKGWDKTECGIHVPGMPDGELPPGYDPVF